VTRTPLSRSKVKITEGGGISWRPPTQLVYVFSALTLLVDNKTDIQPVNNRVGMLAMMVSCVDVLKFSCHHHHLFSFSVLTTILPGEPGIAGFIGAKDNGSGEW